jgi:putative peptidoglycan lipid II flippase
LKIVAVFAPGLSDQHLFFVKIFLPKMFMFIFFLSGAELLNVALRSKNHFFMPAIGPSLNIVFVIIAGLLANFFGLSASFLATSITIGAMFNFLIMLTTYFYYNMSFAFPTKETLSDSYHVFLKIIPLLCGFGILKTYMIVETIVGSYLQSGEISLLHYSWRLINIPTMIFMSTISTVLLPYFSKMKLLSDLRYKFFFAETVKLFLIIALPIAIQSCIFSTEITTFFYGTSISLAFVQKTSSVIKLLSLGIILNTVNQLMMTLFYSAKDTFTPSSINAFVTCWNIMGNFVGLRFFGMIGIVYSVVIGYVFTTILFLCFLYFKHNINYSAKKTASFFLRYSLMITVFLLLQHFFGLYLISLGLFNLMLPYFFFFLTKRLFGLKLFLLN